MLINTRLPGASITLWTALSVTLPLALITVFLLRLVLRTHQLQVATGSAGLIGEVGMVEQPLAPRGKIIVHGELWDATSAAPAQPGGLVRVTGVDGMTLRVEPVAEESASSQSKAGPATIATDEKNQGG